MKRNLLFSGSLCLLLCVVFTTQAQVKGDPGSPGALIEAAPFQKSGSKLNPDLQKLSEAFSPKAKVAQSTRPIFEDNEGLQKYMQIKGDKVVIDVTITGDPATAKTALAKLGFQATASFGRVISGLIPISALTQLETAAAVRFAKPAYKPLHQSRQLKMPIGSMLFGGGKPPVPVISQGDTAQRSNLARKKYKVEGKGVKVGVMSDSYNNLGGAATGVSHGELPGPSNPFNYRKPVQVLSDLDSGGTDEGRAMAEIVHDVAPGAELAFHTANNGQADFATGIVKLADAGCDVIVDDVIYFTEPYFQDGIIAQAVDQVRAKGVTYFSSAGNSSIRSYESVYRPTTVEPLGAGNGTAHNFSGPGDAPRYLQPIYIPTGGSIICSLQWDQSAFSASGVGCESDFDIYLINSAGRIVSGSTSDNLSSGDPTELFGYSNAGASPTFYLVILKYSGPDPTRLKYILYNDALFYLTNPAIPGILAPALVGHAKAEGAIATGAAWYLNTPAYGVDTPRLEGFSSVGGVANYYDIQGNRIAPLIRNKPEIVAPDGGNTSFFDPFGDGDIPQDTDTFPNFFGTSAAAPHAAGVAALMIESQKLNQLTPAQIKGILSAHTVDMDNPYTDGFDKGFDFASGTGLIKADEAVGEVKFPNNYIKNLSLKPLCSSSPGTTRNWQVINPNPFEVKIDWLLVGSSQHGSLVVPPGDTTFSTAPLYIRGLPLPTIVAIDWKDAFGFSRLDLAYSSKAQCGKEAVSEANSDRLISTTATGFADGSLKPVNIAEVYPNPSTSVFRLYLSLADQATSLIDVYSADGRKMQTKVVAQSSGVIDIDASGYRPGIYLLKLTQGRFTKTVKLIKQ